MDISSRSENHESENFKFLESESWKLLVLHEAEQLYGAFGLRTLFVKFEMKMTPQTPTDPKSIFVYRAPIEPL